MPEVARTVTSARNPLLKDIRRAAFRGALTDDGFAIAETFHLLEEALRSDCEIKLVLAAESVHSTVEAHVRGLARLKVLVLADSVFNALSTTESSQGVLALVRPPAWTLDQLFRGQSLVAVLDGIQDPGNAGAIVRAAEAFGATGLFFVKGTVNPWNPKTLRASAGSLFRMPISAGLGGDLVRTALEQRRIDVYAAMPGDHPRPLADLDLTRRCAFLIGNEGRGLSELLRRGATDIRIPTRSVESLNAAMAAGILLYEAARQRLLRP
ncbi:MAG: RNA methyltransferase [Bryobacteraceae bacterium]|nr:RNA methyltransferase [Bryobacteraceae bacterium]